MKTLTNTLREIDENAARIQALEADLAHVREFEENLAERGGTPSESEVLQIGRNQILRVTLPKEIERAKGAVEGLSAAAFAEAGRLRRAAMKWLADEALKIESVAVEPLERLGLTAKHAASAVRGLNVPVVRPYRKSIDQLQSVAWDQRLEPRAYAQMILATLQTVEQRIGQPLRIK